MILHTDHYFSIGQAHLGQGSPCQDFAVSGSVGETAFAIVADGCSTGGLTDVGARLVALSTAQAVRECVGRGKDWNKIQALISTQQQAVMISSRRMLGLHHSDMLATCIYAMLSPHGGFVHLQGDGVVAFKDRNGWIRIYRYDWAGNMPAYPAYAEDNYSAFVTAQSGELSAIRLEVESWDYLPGFDFNKLEGQKITLRDGIGGVTMPVTPQHLADGLEYVAIFSDGVTQIDGQDWKQAVVELLAFKGVAGEFAKRRMIRHIKDSQKSGKGPIDDIAYSVIRVAEEVPRATHP